MSRNHVNAKAAKTAKKNLSKRCFAPFAIFAFNVILSQALTPPRDGAAAAPQRSAAGAMNAAAIHVICANAGLMNASGTDSANNRSSRPPPTSAGRGGAACRAAPIERVLEAFLERDDRRVAERCLRLRDVGLRVHDITRP